jgi:hypothetical protein
VDATFIIFHAGNWERIGIRQRSTGTLFLSKLIDVTSVEDGPYMLLQTALMTCILEDLLSRANQLMHIGAIKLTKPLTVEHKATRATLAKEKMNL